MEMEVLEGIKSLKTEMKGMLAANGEIIQGLEQKYIGMQKQLDALDVTLAQRHSMGGAPTENLHSFLEKSDDVARMLRDKKGVCVIEIPGALLERKTTIDSAAVGRMTSGVLAIDRTPGVVQEARARLGLRDLLTARETTFQVIDFVKVNSALARASMQTESSAKAENAVTFTTGSVRVQTIATTIPVSKQVLDDMQELTGFLETGLSYYVNLTEEVQMLTGSGTGNDLTGLVTGGTAYNTALNSYTPGWKKQDIIARAMQQIQAANEIPASFAVLHPNDFWDIKLTKDGQGRYLNPNGNDTFWGLTPFVTTTIGAGNFLVGSGDQAAAEIRDRMTLTVEISTQHQDFFVKNLLMLRAEKRMALVTYRTGSYVQGSLNTSP